MRLIDADALLLELNNPKGLIILDGRAALVSNEWGCLMRHKDVIATVESAPTIDAEPVCDGHVVWKNRFMGGFVHDATITDNMGVKHTGTLDTTHYEPVPYCSNCGKELGVSSLAYCPNCGVKMDGGAKDGN